MDNLAEKQNNLKQLRAQYEALGKEIDKLEAEPVLNGRASEGEIWFFADGPGSDAFKESDPYGACRFHTVGNYFLKEQHAQTRADLSKVWGQFTRVAIEIADGWEPDWSNSQQKTFCVEFCAPLGRFLLDVEHSFNRPMTVYLPTPEAAQQLADWANNNERLMAFMKGN